MTDATAATPAGDPLDVLAAARKAMAQATMPALKAALEKAEDIPVGKLPDVIAMLTPMLRDGNVKTGLSLMGNQLPALPQLLKQAFAEIEKADV